MKTSALCFQKNFLAESHLSPFSGPGNSSRKCSGLFPNIIRDHSEAENPLCPRPPGTPGGLSVRGTRHPHTGDVGKMVSVLEDLRSGKGHRTGPCERVRHTNITKINQMEIHTVVRNQVQT